ncbi:MAG: hypothetical protein ACUVSV_10110 [Armatimonadota bacterium]
MTWRSVGAQFCLWLSRQTLANPTANDHCGQPALSPVFAPSASAAQPTVRVERVPDAV